MQDVRLLSIAVNAPPGERPLSYAEQDAKQMRRAFTSALGSVPRDGARLLVGSRATRAAVLDHMDAARHEPPDHMIVTWSGHGSEDGIALADGMLTYRELGAAFARIRSRTRTLISDTCHAGAAWGALITSGGGDVSGVVEQDWIWALRSAVPGLRLLAAVSSTQNAHEDRDTRSGRFTFALLMALRSLPGDIATPRGTRFISDFAAGRRARSIIAKRWPNSPLPQVYAPTGAVGSFPLMRSQAERVLGEASVAHLGYAGPNDGVAASLVLDVRGRRGLKTHVAWTASDDTGQVIAKGPACVDATGDSERIPQTLVVDREVLLAHPRVGEQLRAWRRLRLTWRVVVSDDLRRVLARSSFEGTYDPAPLRWAQVG